MKIRNSVILDWASGYLFIGDCGGDDFVFGENVDGRWGFSSVLMIYPTITERYPLWLCLRRKLRGLKYRNETIGAGSGIATASRLTIFSALIGFFNDA